MSETPSTKLSIRLDLANGTRFGPGKAQLLGRIHDEGSIAAAARTLDMSYPRALRLVNELNSQFRTELIEKRQGGAERGGAFLTRTGKTVLNIYLAISRDAERATENSIKPLSELINN